MIPSMHPHCVECGIELPGSHIHRKYCSRRCKGRWRAKTCSAEPVRFHKCRECGVQIELQAGQGNKWLCSAKCRKASTARSVRTFHERRPMQQAIYRARAREKKIPDKNLIRFYRTNPSAPRYCQSCGEDRVLDVAHKPEHPRLGEWRSSKNCKWPEMVWVLCPTCHALIDRMNYTPAEFGLL